MTVLITSSGIFSHFFLFLLVKMLRTKNSMLVLDFLSLFREIFDFSRKKMDELGTFVVTLNKRLREETEAGRLSFGVSAAEAESKTKTLFGDESPFVSQDSVRQLAEWARLDEKEAKEALQRTVVATLQSLIGTRWI